MSLDCKIWASRCPGDTRNTTFIRTTTLEDQLDVMEISRRLAQNVPMAGVEMPTRALLEQGKRLPGTEFYLVGDGFMAVSDEFIELVKDFDLGAPLSQGPGKDRVEFHPLTIFDHTLEVELDHAHIMHVAVRKPCIDFEASKDVRKIGQSDLWSPPMRLEGRVVVSEAALKGPDLWAAQNLTRTLFFSDHLKRAIEARNWTRITFERCVIAG